MSLSARRAWIEIRLRNVPAITLLNVALRKESVDRNTVQIIRAFDGVRRSPQGERG